jgi:hypothetical protein
MIKKDITFENFNGEEVTRTAYFNLSKTQAMKLVAEHGGMDKYLQSIIDKKDTEGFIDWVENLIYKSYGKRDASNPEIFDTSKEAKDEFKASPAFDELAYTLLTNEKEFTEFFFGILPKQMRDELDKQGLIPKADA